MFLVSYCPVKEILCCLMRVLLGHSTGARVWPQSPSAPKQLHMPQFQKTLQQSFKDALMWLTNNSWQIASKIFPDFLCFHLPLKDHNWNLRRVALTTLASYFIHNLFYACFLPSPTPPQGALLGLSFCIMPRAGLQMSTEILQTHSYFFCCLHLNMAIIL